MMNETLYLITRSLMFLVILYIQVKGPKFTSSNIILGVKIPNDEVNNEELNLIYSKYKRETVFVGIIITIIFTVIGFCQDNIKVLYLFRVTLIIFVLSLFFVYWRYNKKVKDVKKREDWKNLAENVRVMDISHSKERQRIKSIFIWAKIPNLIVLGNIMMLIYMYDKLPKGIYDTWNFSNSHGAYVYKSKLSIFKITVAQIIILIIVYLAYYSISRARMYIDPDNIEASIDINKKYVNKWSNMLIGNLIVVQIVLTYINMANLGITTINSMLVNFFSLFTFLIIVVNIYIINKLNKEISIINKIEKPSKKYYIEDDEFWKLGNSFYYNPNDPAIFVKSRSGPGHTVNVGTLLGKVVAGLGVVLISVAIIIVIYDMM